MVIEVPLGDVTSLTQCRYPSMGSIEYDLGVVLVSIDLGAVSLGASNSDLADAVDDEL